MNTSISIGSSAIGLTPALAESARAWPQAAINVST